MSNWVTMLNNLKSWFEAQPTIVDRSHGCKLFAELESEIHAEFRDANKREEHNFTAMTPPPYGILQRPDPICTHCGMVMQVRHTGGLTYVIDHGAPGPACPNAYKMWKMTAAYIPFDEQVLVPAFVREAMAKNS